MIRLTETLLNSLTEARLLGFSSYDKYEVVANIARRDISEGIIELLGESIRDTNNSDEAIALFRERVKEL